MRLAAAGAALAFTLFSVSGEAAPSPGSAGSAWGSTATIQLASDHSGANANVAVPVDGVTRSVEELWGHTSIARNGLVFASSTQLVVFSQAVVCNITDVMWSFVAYVGNRVTQADILTTDHHLPLSATLDAEKTWASLCGGSVVDLCSAQIGCRCEGK